MANADAIVLKFKPRVGGKRLRRGARARYFYPREALEQDYFTLGGNGDRFAASLGLLMLTSEKFESHIALLLSQLTNEGFDVSGPQAEYRAMREALCKAKKNADALENWAMKWKMDCTAPALEYHMRRDD